MDEDYQLNKEALWAVPAQVHERLQKNHVQSDYDNFQLSVLYSFVAFVLLIVVAVAALNLGNVSHFEILLGFVVASITGMTVVWLGQWYWMGKHITTSLMALLCLYLFYSGGVQNSGPLYYGVFPTVALFLQGRLRGFIWVIVLLVLTIILSRGAFGFDVDRYLASYSSRVVAITLIIAILTCIPEYFRLKAERDLLLSIHDLESLSYGDMGTQLANRTFLEKMLKVEFNRNLRYGSNCCVMFLEASIATNLGKGSAYGNFQLELVKIVADVLRSNVRVLDVAGRWERRCFLLILPEIQPEASLLLAERLRQQIREAAQSLPSHIAATTSIGIAAMDKGPEQDVLRRAMNGMLAAQRQGGGCYIGYSERGDSPATIAPSQNVRGVS